MSAGVIDTARARPSDRLEHWRGGVVTELELVERRAVPWMTARMNGGCDGCSWAGAAYV
jgi:hypothetical protein